MDIELKMPALSPTMEKGTIAKWLVKVGDRVRPGDILAEIETDKATMEYEAADEGVIRTLAIAEGTDDVPVGTIIATIGEDSGGGDETAPAPAAEPGAVPAALPEPDRAASVAGPAAASPAVAPAPDPVPATPRARLADKVKVSPLAARIAEAKGIDLGTITGTGPDGRIVKADLGLPVAAPVPSEPASPAIAAVPTFVIPSTPHETVRLSGMRKTIARRLTESKQTVPHFYLTARCRLDALLALRGEINASLADRGIKVSVNDMMVKALALALGAVPDAHVQFGGDELYRFERADIAMAVAIDGGLVTPVIRDAGSLSLGGIAAQSKALAGKARDGRLAPEDYQGGTASISNLGMYGVDEMIPVINPPQALILGVGSAIEQPWKVADGIGLATLVACTASFDHRAIDGATAAQFMAALRDLIETPMRIVC